MPGQVGAPRTFWASGISRCLPLSVITAEISFIAVQICYHSSLNNPWYYCIPVGFGGVGLGLHVLQQCCIM